MFDEEEGNCIDNCTKKLFTSDKILKSYLTLVLKQTGPMTMRTIENRLNNPTDSYGPYFQYK